MFLGFFSSATIKRKTVQFQFHFEVYMAQLAKCQGGVNYILEFAGAYILLDELPAALKNEQT